MDLGSKQSRSVFGSFAAPLRRRGGIVIHPGKEVASAIADGAAGADDERTTVTPSPNLKCPYREIEKIGGLRFSEQRIKISGRPRNMNKLQAVDCHEPSPSFVFHDGGSCVCFDGAVSRDITDVSVMSEVGVVLKGGVV
jgi:hypothetical protein